MEIEFEIEYEEDNCKLVLKNQIDSNISFFTDFSTQNLDQILSIMIKIDGTLRRKLDRQDYFNWKIIVENDEVFSQRFKSLIPLILKPKKINNILYDFQVEGKDFLLKNDNCILADDMGLGKSIQCIAALQDLVFYYKAKSILLFCPNSLVANWISEFEKWSKNLIYLYFQNQFKDSYLKFSSKILQSNLTLVPYSQSKNFSEFISKEDNFFDLVICDEAHKLRKSSSLLNKSLMTLNKKRMWLLSGTPMEKDDKDIMTLLTLLEPQKRQSYKHSDNILLNSNLQRLSLRRLKKDVISSLPILERKVEILEMTSEQKALYEKTLKKLTTLPSHERISLITELIIVSAGKDLLDSCKFIRASEIVEDCIERDEKVIIFSNYNEILKTMKKRLILKNINSIEYTGEIDKDSREYRLKKFKNDKNLNVLLLNTQVGGEGLTLTEASNVIFLNEWWNPSSNRQAEDRINRIGQTQKPNIFILRSKNTIDELVGNVLNEKNTIELQFEKALIRNFFEK